MKLMLLGLLLFSVSAGANTFTRYWQRYWLYADVYKDQESNFPVLGAALVDLPDDIIGFCDEIPGVGSMVLFDRDFWLSSSNEERETTFLHEMGHCDLGREHREGYVKLRGQWIPRSLMQAIEAGSYPYFEFQDYYLQELFQKE